MIYELSTHTQATFIEGKADINYSDVRFNYPRDFTLPSEPIMIDGNDSNFTIQVVDVVDTSVKGGASSSMLGSATFYFGRVVPEDVKTGKNTLPSRSLVEIYSTASLAGFEKETSRWYINKEDNFSEISALSAKEKRASSSTTSTYTSAQNIRISNKGRMNYDLINTHNDAYKAFYHLNIASWLWHSRYNDYNATSNCSEHPCFEYIYDSESSNMRGITSGINDGSSFANDFNNTNRRKAIKLLR